MPEFTKNGKHWNTEDHHMWCNYWFSRHPDDCRLCKDLNQKYPMNNLTEEDLMEKYFPEVKKRI